MGLPEMRWLDTTIDVQGSPHHLDQTNVNESFSEINHLRVKVAQLANNFDGSKFTLRFA
jgi:hypothetical protein